MRHQWLIGVGGQALLTAVVTGGRIVREERAARRAQGDLQSAALPDTEEESSTAFSEDPRTRDGDGDDA